MPQLPISSFNLGPVGGTRLQGITPRRVHNVFLTKLPKQQQQHLQLPGPIKSTHSTAPAAHYQRPVDTRRRRAPHRLSAPMGRPPLELSGLSVGRPAGQAVPRAVAQSPGPGRVQRAVHRARRAPHLAPARETGQSMSRDCAIFARPHGQCHQESLEQYNTAQIDEGAICATAATAGFDWAQGAAQ